MENTKRRKMVVILVSMLVIAMMVQGANAQGIAIVKGYIFNETGAGLAGVNVTWENATTGEFYGNFITLDDPAGYYTMTDSFDGSRESLITASKAGYITNSTVKTITAGSPPKYHWINLTLVQDLTPPDITNLQPADGAMINDSTPTISAEYSDASGINTGAVTLTVDGVDKTTSATITESGISYTSTPLADGQHDVSLYVEDNAANSVTVNWTFTVDTVAPVVTIQSPENTTYKVDTVELNCTATDENNISVVWYSLDGGSNVTLYAADNTTFNATLSGLTSDTHCVTVYANDTAGNIAFATVCFAIEAEIIVPVLLYSGWNMFGVPVDVSNYTLPTVLESVEGNYNIILYYNATSEEPEFFDPLIPEYSTLKKLEPGAGYWIDMKENATAEFEGMKFSEFSRDLESGWNMFSVPYGIENQTLPTALSSIEGKYNMVIYYNASSGESEFFDPLIPEYSTLKKLEPGAGYWIDMKVAATFTPEME